MRLIPHAQRYPIIPPSYLNDLCRPVSDLTFHQALWSSACEVLVVPQALFLPKQHQTFSLIGPSTWNGFPLPLCLLPRSNLSSFYKLRKSILFGWTESASVYIFLEGVLYTFLEWLNLSDVAYRSFNIPISMDDATSSVLSGFWFLGSHLQWFLRLKPGVCCAWRGADCWKHEFRELSWSTQVDFAIHFNCPSLFNRVSPLALRHRGGWLSAEDWRLLATGIWVSWPESSYLAQLIGLAIHICSLSFCSLLKVIYFKTFPLNLKSSL